MFKKSIKLLFFSLLSITILLAGCSNRESTSSSGKNEITVGINVDATSMDPPMSTSTTDKIVLSQIFDTLLFRDDDMKVQPLLATEWKLIDDTTWEFNLKEGIKFHNGEEFNAEDVKYSIDRIIDPNSKAPSKSQFTSIEKVEVVNDFTIQIFTTEPYPVLPKVLTELWIVPNKYTEEKGQEVLAKEPVGTGPFKFVNWVKDEEIVLEGYKDYWRGAPQLEKVTFKPIPEVGTRIAMLKTGEIDIVSGLPPHMVSELETNEKVEVATVLGARSYFLGLNTTEDTPIANPKVREALGFAINVEEIVNETLSGYGKQLSSLLTPNDFGFDPDLAPIEYNPEKAKQLLAEAGYPNGFDIDFSAPNGRYLMDKEVAQVITGQLKEVGINVNILIEEWGTFISAFASDTAKVSPIWFMGWSIPTFDADAAVYALWTPNTYSRYDNPKMTELLTEARYTMDENARLDMYHEAQALARKDMVQVPLYQTEDIYGKNKRVNWTPRADERISLYEVTVE
jgi:peptide/nickel transport system substrate-binding protein